MSLVKSVAAYEEPINGFPCSVGSLMASLESTPAELAEFQRIMYGRPGLTEPRTGYKGWTERAVFEVVTDAGLEVAKNQINEHRGKRCRCYRGAR